MSSSTRGSATEAAERLICTIRPSAAKRTACAMTQRSISKLRPSSSAAGRKAPARTISPSSPIIRSSSSSRAAPPRSGRIGWACSSRRSFASASRTRLTQPIESSLRSARRRFSISSVTSLKAMTTPPPASGVAEQRTGSRRPSRRTRASSRERTVRRSLKTPASGLSTGGGATPSGRRRWIRSSTWWSGQLVLGPSEHPLGGRVHADQAALVVELEDAVGDRLQRDDAELVEVAAGGAVGLLGAGSPRLGAQGGVLLLQPCDLAALLVGAVEQRVALGWGSRSCAWRRSARTPRRPRRSLKALIGYAHSSANSCVSARSFQKPSSAIAAAVSPAAHSSATISP